MKIYQCLVWYKDSVLGGRKIQEYELAETKEELIDTYNNIVSYLTSNLDDVEIQIHPVCKEHMLSVIETYAIWAKKWDDKMVAADIDSCKQREYKAASEHCYNQMKKYKLMLKEIE